MKKALVVALIVVVILVLALPSIASAYYTCTALGCQTPKPTLVRPTQIVTPPSLYWCMSTLCGQIPRK